MSRTAAPARRRARGAGRPRATTHLELERAAIRLFTADGFEATSVDDIAAAAGISRRTFFRYFPAKADVVWADCDAAIGRMRDDLESAPPGLAVVDAVGTAVVRANDIPPGEIDYHRRRMALILGEPALIARSSLWHRRWRGVIADFVADQLGQDPDDLRPRTISRCVLGAALAAYEKWLDDGDADLADLLEESLRALAVGFADDCPADRPREAAL